MNNAEKLLLDSVMEVLEEYEHFMMGSRRFGYDSIASDYDYCVLLPASTNENIAADPYSDYLSNDKYENLMCDLRMLGFQRVLPSTEDYGTPSEHLRSATRLIDIIFINDEDTFYKKKEQHERLSKILTGEIGSFALSFIQVLKQGANIKGSEIYRALCSTLLHEKAL